jgi:DNA-binding NarL/FixJ family response regulator
MSHPPKANRKEKIRLLVADDHMVMRMGLVFAASAQPDLEVIAEVDSGEATIEAYRKHRPDVVIIDLRMRGMGGLAAIRALKAEFHTIRIVVFSNYARGEEVYQALRAGAAGFVVKNMNLTQLLDAIRRVYAGERYLPAELAASMGTRSLSPLSERETEVLGLIAKGRSNKEIGSLLGVTEGTVKIHVTNILSKLEVNARTEALVVAVQRGIIDIA